LISPPILKYPDYSRQFVLTTDTSNEGVGAVLSQGEIGKNLPVAFASRSKQGSEKLQYHRKETFSYCMGNVAFHATSTK
jgi:hypothetical protein